PDGGSTADCLDDRPESGRNTWHASWSSKGSAITAAGGSGSPGYTGRSMPEITFLGTGTSNGIPVIGCDCEVCRSTDPRDRRGRTSAVVRYGDRSILIDAATELRSQAL